MHLRPIHLTSKSRIEQLNRRFGLSIPREWQGQVLFEWGALPSMERRALTQVLQQHKQAVVKSRQTDERIFFNASCCFDYEIPREVPQSIKEGFDRISRFLQGTEAPRWEWGNGRLLDFNRGPFVMGILNVTPDSFSDGGKFYKVERAVNRALQMVAEGADIIDVGGESTRPGANPVNVEEETARVVPVIAAIKSQSDVLISVDTYKSAVALKALDAGADLVNDISGARFDPDMISVVQRAGCPLIIMHIKGTPRDMQKNPYYDDVVQEIFRYFEERLQALQEAGVEMVAIDPGIGFGKRLVDNLQLIRDLKDLTFLDRPILIGTSRKSFIGAVLGKNTDERLFGSLATQLLAVQNGAQIVRVHDVAPTKEVLQMQRAIFLGEQPDGHS